MHTNATALRALKPEDRKRLEGDNLDYIQKRLFDEFWHSHDAEGNISSDGIAMPQKLTILVKPERSLEKRVKLHEFRQQVIDELATNVDGSDTFRSARREILGMYRRRVNQFIMGQYDQALITQERADLLGIEHLSAAERHLLTMQAGLKAPEKNRSRLDKKLFGASPVANENHWQPQIPARLVSYSEQVAQLGEESELGAVEAARKKGLDYLKLTKKISRPINELPGEKRCSLHTA